MWVKNEKQNTKSLLDGQSSLQKEGDSDGLCRLMLQCQAIIPPCCQTTVYILPATAKWHEGGLLCRFFFLSLSYISVYVVISMTDCVMEAFFVHAKKLSHKISPSGTFKACAVMGQCKHWIWLQKHFAWKLSRLSELWIFFARISSKVMPTNVAAFSLACVESPMHCSYLAPAHCLGVAWW